MNRPRILTEDKLNAAIEMRERGCTLGVIARKTGASASVLSWHFLKLNVDPPRPTRLRPNYHLEAPVKKRGNHLVRAFTPEEDARLTELALQGLSHTLIARALGRKPNSINGRLMTLARRQARAEAADASA